MKSRENILSRHIIEAAVEVQRAFGGPGLLESIYEEALAQELSMRGFVVRRQVPVPVHYKGNELNAQLRLDLIVEDLVIIECKAVSRHNDIFITQALTYLRLTNRRLALIVNFGQRPLRKCVIRVANGLPDS